MKLPLASGDTKESMTKQVGDEAETNKCSNTPLPKNKAEWMKTIMKTAYCNIARNLHTSQSAIDHSMPSLLPVEALRNGCVEF